MMDEDDLDDAPEPTITGTVYANGEAKASRLWDLKSTSKAACTAADKGKSPRPIGFRAWPVSSR